MPKAPNTIGSNAKRPRDRRRKRVKDRDPAGAIAADSMRLQALRLKRDQRLSYEDIARQLGVAKSTAFKYVNDGWKNLIEESDEERRLLRAIEDEKLDDLERRFYPIATKDNLVVISTEFGPDGPVEVRKEDIDLQIKAGQLMLKIGKRRAELHGHDAPTKSEVDLRTGNALEPLHVLAARVAEAQAKGKT